MGLIEKYQETKRRLWELGAVWNPETVPEPYRAKFMAWLLSRT